MSTWQHRLWKVGVTGWAIALIVIGLSAGAAVAHPNKGGGPYASGHSYRHGAVPPRGHQSSGAVSSNSNLSYGGGIGGVGVVTGPPKVYLVFWGSQWGTQGTNAAGNVTLSGDGKGMAPYVENFMKGIGTNGETWSGVMTQYCQGVAAGSQTCPANSAHVGYPSGSPFAGVWVDESSAAPSQASGHQIGQEAVNAAAHFGDYSTSSQYVIVSPTGTHPDGYNTPGGQFCAWHDYTGDSTLSGGAVSSPNGPIAFTNLPYIPDMGASCGQSFVNGGTAGALDGVSIVEGHEYAETLTDDFPAGGWTDNTGYENGDKCAWITSGNGASRDITLGTGMFAVQTTWANDYNGGAGGCEVGHPIVTNGSAGNTVTVTNPGNQSSTTSSSVSLQVSGSDSASGQTLSYTAAGLPPGLSISTSGLITGTPTTAGTYSVTVTAQDSTGASGTTSFTWSVSSPSSGGCTAAQLLGNPGFETGTAAPWTTTSGVIQPSSAGEVAHGGNYLAWLDGYGRTHTDTLAQTVTLPSGCSTYTFSYWLHVDTAETTTTTAYDTLKVQVLNSSGTVLTTLRTYSNLNAASGYSLSSFNLAAYAGQKVTLKFTGHEDSSLATSFVVDDTALNVG
jgi:serine protease